MNTTHVGIVLLLLVSQISSAEDRNFANLDTYEVVNNELGTVDTIQRWTEYRTVRQGRRHIQIGENRYRVIKRTPLKRPGHDSLPTVVMPIVASEGESPPEVAIPKKKAPRALLKNPPELESRKFYQTPISLSNDKRNEIIDLLEETKEVLSKWSKNIHSRWDLCPVDKYTAQQDGTWEVLYVPFEAVLGRVWILKSEIETAKRELESDVDPNGWAPKYMQIIRRFEALEFQVQLLKNEDDSEVYDEIPQVVEALNRHVGIFDPFRDVRSRTWILRWDSMLIDAKIWLERVPWIRSQLSATNSHILSKAEAKIKVFLEAAATDPWSQPLADQRAEVELLFEACQSVAAIYQALADLNTQTSNPKHYLDLLEFFGANENLRVYAWTNMQILKDSH